MSRRSPSRTGLAWAAAGALASLTTSSCTPEQPTELVSLVGMPVAEGEYMEAFQIETGGVEILAACHIPFGWHLTLGIDDSVTGSLEGRAGLGPSLINRENGEQLRDLFLVRVPPGDRDDPNMPPFKGTVEIGRYGTDEARTVPIDPRTVVRRPATRCPPPRA
ncbi:MAG TPA: hypothetical protein VF727_01665 [Allosphingosinicella sp.]|jgi:hypothetical protein